MSQPQPAIGAVCWRDLTVPNADEVARFYAAVAGWSCQPCPMGDYDDFEMVDGNGETVAGVCHARGSNANLPPQWLVYINVADADESAARCVELGGTIIDGPRDMGPSRFCAIRDPAGAVAALISTPPAQ